MLDQQQAPADKTVNAYQRLGIAAMKVVYDANGSKALLQMMQGQDPVQGVAMAAMTVLEKLKESVKGINPNFVYAVAPAVVTFICDLGNAAGLFKASAQLVQQAVQVLQDQVKGQAQQPAARPPAQPAAPQGLIGARQPQPAVA